MWNTGAPSPPYLGGKIFSLKEMTYCWCCKIFILLGLNTKILVEKGLMSAFGANRIGNWRLAGQWCLPLCLPRLGLRTCVLARRGLLAVFGLAYFLSCASEP